MKIEKKVAPAFEEFIFDWDYEQYLLLGGYGSGKSYQIAFKLILKCLEEKRKVLVVRNVFETIYESCYALIEGILRDMDIYTERVTDYKTRKTKVLGLKVHCVLSSRIDHK